MRECCDDHDKERPGIGWVLITVFIVVGCLGLILGTRKTKPPKLPPSPVEQSQSADPDTEKLDK